MPTTPLVMNPIFVCKIQDCGKCKWKICLDF